MLGSDCYTMWRIKRKVPTLIRSNTSKKGEIHDWKDAVDGYSSVDLTVFGTHLRLIEVLNKTGWHR